LRSRGKRGSRDPFATVISLSHFGVLQVQFPHPFRYPRSEPIA
jgi:hypothetical protein